MSSSFKRNVRSSILAIRKNKRLTQKQLAFLAGVSLRTYGAFERGESDMSLDRVEKVTEALNIELVPVPRDWKKEL